MVQKKEGKRESYVKVRSSPFTYYYSESHKEVTQNQVHESIRNISRSK